MTILKSDRASFPQKKYAAHASYWEAIKNQLSEPTRLHDKSEELANGKQERATVTHLLPSSTSRCLSDIADGDAYGLTVLFMSALTIVAQRYTGNGTIILRLPPLKSDGSANDLNDSLVMTQRVDTTVNLREHIEQLRKQFVVCNECAGYPASFAQITPEAIQEGTNIVFYNADIHNIEKIRALPGCVFSFRRLKDTIELSVEFDKVKFTEQYFGSLLSHWANVLSAINVPDTLVSDVAIFTDSERAILTPPKFESEFEYNVLQLFEKQAKQTPEAVAVIYNAQKFSYGYINKKAEELALHLRMEYAVEPGKVVSILAEKTERMIISMLAILKAGGIYSPIEPTLPVERVQYILEDSASEVLIIDSKFMFHVGDYSGHCFVADLQLNDLATPNETLPAVEPETPAYLIYTSGSTGKPKGVVISHRSFSNTLNWRKGFYNLDETDVHLQFFSFAFDGSITDTFSSLISGGTLVMVPDERKGDVGEIASLIEAHHVTHMILVPTFYEVLMEELSSKKVALKAVTVAGEALTERVRQMHFSNFPDVRLVNEYGPTENAVCSTCCEITTQSPISIGPPITNVRAYALDGNLLPVPIGTPGELCVGGAGLALGYWRNEAMTKEKFVFASCEQGKIYKTGDLVRITRDGAIEYIGRIDHQVKIRGYRIELEEIRKTSATVEGVSDAVILPRVNPSGITEILAYYKSEEKGSVDLKASLKMRLPEYMVPAHCIKVDAFPLTAVGKIDVKMLPVPEAVMEREHQHVVPESLSEFKLVDIWEGIFRKSPIGITDDFFELGGNSLMATQVMIRINKEFNIKAELSVIFENPTIQSLALAVDSGKKVSYNNIEVIEQNSYYEVSHGQKRIWILDQFDTDQPAYTISSSYKIEGDINETALKMALETLVERHEILRTTFLMHDGRLKQKVHPIGKLDFEIENLMDLPDKESVAWQLIQESASTKFNLRTGPLLKVKLIKVSDGQYWITLCIHHIISDAWSLKIIVDELSHCYNAYDRGEQPGLPPLPIQHKDYAHSRLKKEQEGLFTTQAHYWHKQLEGVTYNLNALTDYVRPKIKTFNGEAKAIQLGSGVRNGLLTLGKQQGVTQFMMLLGIVKSLLFRNTNQCDVVIGTPISGRNDMELENQIGFFINSLALRTVFKGTDSFYNLLRKIKRTTLEAFANQDYPFDLLVEETSLERDPSHSPLFDVMIVVVEGDHAAEATFQGIDFEPLTFTKKISKFDLTFMFRDNDGNLDLAIEYNTDLFKESTIDRLLIQLKRIAEAVIQNPDRALKDLNLHSETELDTLAQWSGGKKKPEYLEKAWIELFNEKSRQMGTRVALEEQGRQVSYDALQSDVNALAKKLQSQIGVKEGDVVAVLARRSVTSVTGILATMQLNAVFVPIDPEYPLDRINHILNDCCATVLLFDEGFMEEGLEFAGPTLALSNRAMAKVKGRIQISPKPIDLAYILFTSGTNGKPKGVGIEQRSFANYIRWANQHYFATPSGYHFPLFTSLSFDLTLTSLFATLLRGDKVVLFPGSDLTGTLNSIFTGQSEINAVKLTPSHVSLLAELELKNSPVECVILGGEALTARQIECLKGLNPTMGIFNEYGPTESTVGCMISEISSATDEITIGEPIANTTTYIVDEQFKLQPSGMKGEILIGGTGLARGYINNPELTHQKFITIDINGSPERLYRSGDVGKWSTTGDMQFFGRNDRQVKVRGNRVELGEIEEAICRSLPEREVLVILRDQCLVAYLASTNDNEIERLKNNLSKQLPAYMVPSFFVSVPQFKLTVNGKIDQRGLPDPVLLPTQEQDTAPETEMEEIVHAIWKEILGKDRISVAASFFDVGGHSLNGMQLLSRIYKRCHVKLDLKHLFLTPTIRSLAALLEDSEKTQYGVVESVAEETDNLYELSHAQRRLWVLHQMEPTLKAYNITQAYLLSGELDIDALKKAFTTLVQRHESLRTVFVTVNGEPRQKILSTDTFNVEYIDLSNEPDPVVKAREISLAEVNRIFDLENGPLFLVKLVKLSDAQHGCLLSMHHLTSDGWSVSILRRELMMLYQSFAAGEANPLLPLRIQYKDFGAWQNQQIKKRENNKHREYWISQFTPAPPTLELHPDFNRSKIRTYNGKTLDFLLSKELNLGLNQLARKNGGSLYIAVLSLVNVLLHKLSNQCDLVIGSPSAGRSHQDLENQIGFYLNTLALRTTFSPNDTFNDILKNVKTVVLDGFEHEIYPFDALVDELGMGRDVSRSALFDVFVILHNFEGTLIELNKSDQKKEAANELEMEVDLGVETVGLASQTSMYDLTFAFQEEQGALKMMIQYNTDLFTRERIERIAGNFENLVKLVVDQPDVPIKLHNIITKDELDFIHRLNDTDRSPEYFHQNTFVQLFESKANVDGRSIAAICNNDVVSYANLNANANQLAWHLKENAGLINEDFVVVIMERSIATIEIILSIWKCGATYIPLSPQDASNRILSVIDEVRPKVVIAGRNVFDETMHKAVEANSKVLVLEECVADIEKFPKTNLNVPVSPSSLAYVIYTSGSTGKPKGAMIEHAGMLNHMFSKIDQLAISHTSKIVQNAPQVFDISIWQLFTALLCGGTIVVYDQRKVMDVPAFLEALNRDGITILEVVPSYLSAILSLDEEGFELALPSSLNYVVVTGETLRPSLVKLWFEKFPQIKLVNAYGPTEASDDITHFMMDSDPSRTPVPVGKTIQNMKIYILDEALNPCPLGVEGMIYVSGLGVGKGYLFDTDLTRASFMTDTFSNRDVRMYCTGDVGRYLPDGNIEFLGRKDWQVKLNGYRIELGEVENAVLSLSEVRTTTVQVLTDAAGSKFLCAYVVLKHSAPTDASEWTQRLKQILPVYMLPKMYFELDTLPLTVNGKVDRKNLPLPSISMEEKKTFELPESETERALWRIWTRVLETTRFGVKDNFFEVGGDSIKALRAFALVSKRFPDAIKITDFFVYNSITSLAQVIDHTSPNADETNLFGSVSDSEFNTIQKVIL
jgi:amino acid adenylation domain-containing protein